MRPSPEQWGAAFRTFRSTITCRTGATRLRRQATCYSVISSLLCQVYGWVPVHVSAGDGLNSWPGDKLQQGASGLIPDDLSMTVSMECFSNSARFQFPIQTDLLKRFDFSHAMPKPYRQSAHYRNQGDLFLFRILRDQSLVRLPRMSVVTHMHPAGLTQHFAQSRRTLPAD